MRKIYQLYLASNFITPLLVSTLFFVAFLLTFELFRLTDLLMTKDIGIDFVLGLMGNISLTFVPLALPLSIFFSTMFSLNKLCGDSEYIALRAAGITNWKIYQPYLVVSIIVAVNVHFLNAELIPNANRQFREKTNFLSSNGLITGMKTGQFFTSIRNITLFPGSISEDNVNMENIFLHIYNKENQKEKIILAKEGELLHDKNEETAIESLRLKLKKGNIVESTMNDQDVEKILFEEYVLPISEKKFSSRIRTRETMLNRVELKKLIDDGPTKALKRGFGRNDYFNAKYEYWNRLNTPLICLLFTFVGFALGVKGNRSRGRNSGFLGIMILIGYYVLFFSGISIARSSNIPLPLTLGLPALVLAATAYYHYSRLDWQS